MIVIYAFALITLLIIIPVLAQSVRDMKDEIMFAVEYMKDWYKENKEDKEHRE